MMACGQGGSKCGRNAVCLTLLVALLACLVVSAAQGQFFTKANSKSIPRMGRRSPADPNAKLDGFRRMLIDRLVDEFGPELLAQLRPEIKLNPTAGELYLRNEQPFDLNARPMAGGEQAELFAMEQPAGAQMMSRDERAAAGDGSVSRQNYNNKNTKSLAMRAFNADRLLQHLASGGSPLLAAYGNNYVEPKDQRNVYD